jgi:hypothetical protein
LARDVSSNFGGFSAQSVILTLLVIALTIGRGRAKIARGEFVTFEEIKRDLEADLLEQCRGGICESTAEGPSHDP